MHLSAMMSNPKHCLSKVVKFVVVHIQTLVDERGKHRHIGVNPWKKVLLHLTKYGIRLMNIWDDISSFCGPLIPLFETSGNVYPGFQNRMDPCVNFCLCAIYFWDSLLNMTPVNLLAAKSLTHILFSRSCATAWQSNLLALMVVMLLSSIPAHFNLEWGKILITGI